MSVRSESELGQSIDRELVDRAVADLNAIYTSKALETACLIGEYVLDRFFGGSICAFRQGTERYMSFRALSKHSDLRFSSTYLWTAVAVVGQLSELPEEVGRHLPLSHHRLLLPVRDTATKTSLAKMAVEVGLSKRELAKEIARLPRSHQDKEKRRLHSSCVMEAMAALVEASERFVLAASAQEGGISKTPRARVQTTLERLEVDLDAVRCVVNMLRSRLEPASRFSGRVSPGKHVVNMGSRTDDC